MPQKIGRLAMRVEGENWVAYYALPDTMLGAIFLGSIRLIAVAENEARKSAFMEMMRDLVSDVIENQVGERPSWKKPVAAPDNERSGSA